MAGASSSNGARDIPYLHGQRLRSPTHRQIVFAIPGLVRESEHRDGRGTDGRNEGFAWKIFLEKDLLAVSGAWFRRRRSMIGPLPIHELRTCRIVFLLKTRD